VLEMAKNAYDSVRPIFASITDSRAPVYSTIENNTPGRIYVDRPDAPQTALLRFSGGEMYLAGDASDPQQNREIIDLMLGDLAPDGPHLLIFSFSEAWKPVLDDLLADHGVTRVVRDVFELDPDRFRAAHSGWQDRIPEGFRMVAMDQQLALEADAGVVKLWGSVANFLTRAFGYCLMRGDEIISRVSPVALGDRRFETGAHTAEPYRRQGMATLAGCAFISRCLDEGLLPEWGCYYNEASGALARRLGFVAKPDVIVHYVKMEKDG